MRERKPQSLFKTVLLHSNSVLKKVMVTIVSLVISFLFAQMSLAQKVDLTYQDNILTAKAGKFSVAWPSGIWADLNGDELQCDVQLWRDNEDPFWIYDLDGRYIDQFGDTGGPVLSANNITGAFSFSQTSIGHLWRHVKIMGVNSVRHYVSREQVWDGLTQSLHSDKGTVWNTMANGSTFDVVWTGASLRAGDVTKVYPSVIWNFWGEFFRGDDDVDEEDGKAVGGQIRCIGNAVNVPYHSTIAGWSANIDNTSCNEESCSILTGAGTWKNRIAGDRVLVTNMKATATNSVGGAKAEDVCAMDITTGGQTYLQKGVSGNTPIELKNDASDRIQLRRYFQPDAGGTYLCPITFTFDRP